ncbi:MAG: porin family protein [Symploca sp. SIO2D2]|nr:porin family protein [Symploca sp. SIO2D2]
MKYSRKSIYAISALAATMIIPVVVSAGNASAETRVIAEQSHTRGTDANYIGGGVAAGITNGGQDGDAANLGINIQGRLTTPQAPVSLRGAVLAGEETTAIMPILSYDVGVTKNTNVYVGGGYSFVEEDGKPSPLGNRDAVVLTAGAETEFAHNIVGYTDVKVGINAYENSPAEAVSLQAGVGYSF